MTWKRSFGTLEGATATGSDPSWLSMTSRPGWNSCPNRMVPWGATAATRRR